MSKVKKNTVELTCKELYIASDILERVAGVMSWDSELGEYVDGGNFLYACSKGELTTLKNLLKKL
jgi:hypothetical protein